MPAGRRATLDKALVGVIHDDGTGRWRGRATVAVPRQPRRCQTAVLIVFHLDRRVARQVDRAIVRTERLIVPLVNQQVTVHPQAHTVVGRRRETVRTRLKVKGARPADREIVAGNTRRRRTIAPVEAEVRVVTHQDRRIVQPAVGEVFAAPALRRGGDRLPRDPSHGQAPVLVVFYHDRVVSARQVDVAGEGLGGMIVPLVDDQVVVGPDADAVVAGGREAVRARLKRDHTYPADREPIARNVRSR